MPDDYVEIKANDSVPMAVAADLFLVITVIESEFMYPIESCENWSWT